VKGFDTVDFGAFFELDNGGGHALRGHNWKLKQMQATTTSEKMLFQSENHQ